MQASTGLRVVQPGRCLLAVLVPCPGQCRVLSPTDVRVGVAILLSCCGSVSHSISLSEDHEERNV